MVAVRHNDETNSNQTWNKSNKHVMAAKISSLRTELQDNNNSQIIILSLIHNGWTTKKNFCL